MNRCDRVLPPWNPAPYVRRPSIVPAHNKQNRIRTNHLVERCTSISKKYYPAEHHNLVVPSLKERKEQKQRKEQNYLLPFPYRILRVARTNNHHHVAALLNHHRAETLSSASHAEIHHRRSSEERDPCKFCPLAKVCPIPHSRHPSHGTFRRINIVTDRKRPKSPSPSLISRIRARTPVISWP